MSLLILMLVHDYLDDVDRRFDYYHQKLERIEFDLSYFNKITKGQFAKQNVERCIGRY